MWRSSAIGGSNGGLDSVTLLVAGVKIAILVLGVYLYRSVYRWPVTANPFPLFVSEPIMNLGFEAFRLRAHRMRGLMDYIGSHLDESLRLEDIAGFVELSPTHLVRIYQSRVGEAPMQTVRRLRLERALEQIRARQFRTLTDVGFDAGYGSSAAFTHAFLRHFGFLPSQVGTQLSSRGMFAPLHLEFMPPLKVWQMPYSGAYLENGYFKTRLAWCYSRAGGRGWRGWRLNDRDNPFCENGAQRVELAHFLPVTDERLIVSEAEQLTFPGGLYAVAIMLPEAREANMRTLPHRIRTELGCQCIEGRLIERDIDIRDFRVPQERRIALYIPVTGVAPGPLTTSFDPHPVKTQIPIKTR